MEFIRQEGFFFHIARPPSDCHLKSVCFFLQDKVKNTVLSYTKNRKMKKSTIRTIESICFCRMGSRIHISFTGNGFLQQMVRILSGTLIEVGVGKRKPEEMARVLEARERSVAGFTAPPEGLFLENVEYGDLI